MAILIGAEKINHRYYFLFPNHIIQLNTCSMNGNTGFIFILKVCLTSTTLSLLINYYGSICTMYYPDLPHRGLYRHPDSSRYIRRAIAPTYSNQVKHKKIAAITLTRNSPAKLPHRFHTRCHQQAATQ